MKKNLPLIVLFTLAAILRFVNLGYSDYQGDEFKALYNPKESNSIQFFLDQRKGPMQFIVTASLKNISNNYRDRFLVRLPFALAGFGAVVVFYLLVKNLFGQKIAFYSSIFFATNGFFVAFSRIVQYQSFVIFFGLLAIYLVYRYFNKLNPYLLVTAGISLAVSILSHYDGVFFLPIIFGLLMVFLSNMENGPKRSLFLKHALLAGAIFTILVGAFYVPFALNIAQNTMDYWAGRLSGDISGKVSSSRYLFSVYQPIYVLHVYTILGIIGFILVCKILTVRVFPYMINKLIIRRRSVENVVALHNRINIWILLSALIWFLIPFIVMEIVVSIPGTHIYTYLIPVFLFMGLALDHLEIVGQKIVLKTKVLLSSGIAILFAFVFVQSYWVFVDHVYEYPWEEKGFLVWTFPKPIATFHLSLFGFPYNRYWTEVADFIAKDNKSSYYSTNERSTMPRYYISLEKDINKAGYYVYIHNSQKLIDTLTNKRILGFMKNNKPVLTFYNGDRAVTQVYYLPEPAKSNTMEQEESE